MSAGMYYVKVTYEGRAKWVGPFGERRAEREASWYDRHGCKASHHKATPDILTQVAAWQTEATRVAWSA